MQKLLEGTIKFKKKDFEKYRSLFESMGKSQKPHTLFISCSDSRIDSHMITNTLPGEIFVVRNIANIVPPYRKTNEYVATTSAIEYAVLCLEVENIIVCGHSNCGGCAACLNPSEKLKELPHTQKWLELAYPVRDRVLAQAGHEDLTLKGWMMEQANVVEQIKHLMTYPYIRSRVREGRLSISGWYYIIEKGEVYVYDKETGEFILSEWINFCD